MIEARHGVIFAAIVPTLTVVAGIYWIGNILGAVEQRLESLEHARTVDRAAFTSALDRQAATNDKLSDAILELRVSIAAAGAEWAKERHR